MSLTSITRHVANVNVDSSNLFTRFRPPVPNGAGGCQLGTRVVPVKTWGLAIHARGAGNMLGVCQLVTEIDSNGRFHTAHSLAHALLGEGEIRCSEYQEHSS